MIKHCEKIKSEVYFTIDSISVDNDSGEIDIICYINNYFHNEGSLGLFQFSINGGGSYANATLAAVQTEPDFDEILLNHKQRKLHIIWNALTDIGAAAA
ncbi:MAG: hypothetical protein K8R79_07050, partial [Calditrichales bacterium]|nr:hypothetical protein [Calditrichales bacterium]